MDTSCNTGNFSKILGKRIPPCEWWNTWTGSQRGCGISITQNNQKFTLLWTPSCATCPCWIWFVGSWNKWPPKGPFHLKYPVTPWISEHYHISHPNTLSSIAFWNIVLISNVNLIWCRWNFLDFCHQLVMQKTVHLP